MNGKRNEAIRGKKVLLEDLIYIAGLFDGEGCVNIYQINTDYMKQKERRKVPKWVLSVTIYNCDFEIINWLYESFGGYLQRRVRNNPKWRQNYAWKLSANKALEFLKRIEPYLRIKKEQALTAIEFQENQSRFNQTKKGKPIGMSEKDMKFREDCWLKIKALNRGTFTRRD